MRIEWIAIVRIDFLMNALIVAWAEEFDDTHDDVVPNEKEGGHNEREQRLKTIVRNCGGGVRRADRALFHLVGRVG
jgi:hypothetical protein